MKARVDADVAQRPFGRQTTRSLLERVGNLVVDLVKKEVTLARLELKADVARELRAAKSIAAAIVCGVAGVTLLLVALVFAMARTMPGWLAATIVGVVVLAIGGITFAVGWSKRVKMPLEITRETVQEDVEWAKERFS
jgi:uncharacterized membrane protein YqjE